MVGLDGFDVRKGFVRQAPNAVENGSGELILRTGTDFVLTSK
jgi:hypothetical protein